MNIDIHIDRPLANVTNQDLYAMINNEDAGSAEVASDELSRRVRAWDNEYRWWVA